MSENTNDALIDQANYTDAKVREFATQIESGDYITRECVKSLTDFAGNVWAGELATWYARESGESLGELVETYGENVGYGQVWDVDLLVDYIESDGRYSIEDGDVFEVTEHDEPSLVDSYGNVTPISEYPLEVVDERGREFAVVLTVGGPHIEIHADGLQSARLSCYWGGETVHRSGDHYSTFLDHFIDRD